MARPENPTSVYLDANPLIYTVLGKAGHEPVVELLALANAGRIHLYTSRISFVEVRGYPNNMPVDEAVEAAALTILDNPRLIKVELSRHVAMAARRLGHRHKLKNYDAIHLASAIEAEVDVLMTSDIGMKGARGRKIEGVWVDEPYFPGPDRLI